MISLYNEQLTYCMESNQMGLQKKKKKNIEEILITKKKSN